MEKAPPGVQAVETSSRFHPEGDLASALLGFIGRDETGLAGIEADFDHELGGVPGLVYLERDGRGKPIPFGRKVGTKPEAGGDVQLTIDRYIQSLIEQKLDATIEKNKASGATIIVMDPKTGEVLAMASRPSFQLSKLNLDDPSQAELYRNRPVTDFYEPGSVMKTITMATAIDLGLVNPNTTYFDSGEAVVEGGSPIKNWDFSAHGTTTMTQVLQYSLNTGAVWVARQIGASRFYDSIKRFGFGQATNIGLGGEAAGIVRTNQEDGWYPVDLATNAFGQGIDVTPVQMITAISSLVNGGQLMRPYIVKEVSGPDGPRTYEPVVVRRTISEETSRTLVQMMEAVVDGQPGHQAQVPGYHVGGKTGTTTFPGKIDTIASFVGFAPVEDPKFIMLVRIDSPRDSLGGVIAAPVFSDIAPKILSYLGVEPNPRPVITASEVAEYLGSLLHERRGPANARFRDVVIDSRQAGRGDFFVALRGERTDGQEFAVDAIERGARGLLLCEAAGGLPRDVTSFVVSDTLLALQRLAAGRRDRRRTKVVAITGSVGKTTTKEIVASVLGVKYRVLKSEANYNNEIGLPLTLLKLTNRHQRAVLEMGMYALGEIRTLCEIARPEIGVVTNVGPVHLERLGSMEAIAAAKAELLESLPPHGFAVMNADDPFVRTMADRTRARPLFYGLAEGAAVRATDVSSRGLDGVSFRLHYEGRSVAVETKLPGRHIVSNALAAAAVGLADGLSLEDVAGGLATADVQVRIRTHVGRNGATLIDDTYNASPASTLAALDLLAEIRGGASPCWATWRSWAQRPRKGT